MERWQLISGAFFMLSMTGAMATISRGGVPIRRSQPTACRWSPGLWSLFFFWVDILVCWAHFLHSSFSQKPFLFFLRGSRADSALLHYCLSILPGFDFATISSRIAGCWLLLGDCAFTFPLSRKMFLLGLWMGVGGESCLSNRLTTCLFFLYFRAVSTQRFVEVSWEKERNRMKGERHDSLLLDRL